MEDEDAATVVARLEQAGFPTADVTAIEEAQAAHPRSPEPARSPEDPWTGRALVLDGQVVKCA